jgi:FtsH-binding integral membrane protein
VTALLQWHDDLQVRHAFICKVLALLALELAATAAIAVSILMPTTARGFLFDNPLILLVAWVAYITYVIALACSEDARRHHPTNLLLLLGLILVQGMLVGTMSGVFSNADFILALSFSACTCLVLIGWATQQLWDFTASTSILISAATVTLLGMLLASSALQAPPLTLLAAGCYSLLGMAYAVYDVQVVANGEHTYQLAPDEFVFATLNFHTGGWVGKWPRMCDATQHFVFFTCKRYRRRAERATSFT